MFQGLLDEQWAKTIAGHWLGLALIIETHAQPQARRAATAAGAGTPLIENPGKAQDSSSDARY